MIALGIRYLTKYAVASNLARQTAEWPPHPGRIFMAMAAAHFESGGDPGERIALEWLESAAPPAMRVSGADERTAVRAYVPVNDVHGGIVSRPKQERAFLRVRPHEDSLFLIWESEPDAPVRGALDRVCRKVTRIGHSSSVAQMWVVAEGQEPEPDLRPGSGMAGERLRVASAGTLQSLAEAFNGDAISEYDRLADALTTAKGKEKTRIKNELASRFGGVRPESRRPSLVRWQGYERVAERPVEEVIEGPFDPNFVVLTKREGASLGLEPTLQLTAAIRNAAMKAAGANPPEWLSGHDDTGSPSTRPHVAFFPLPYVGFEFADAHVLGLGMAIPKELNPGDPRGRDAELKRVLGPLFFDSDSGDEREIRLWSKAAKWTWTLRRETSERPPISLQRATWTRPSRIWASVTPVVLHHHPKKNREGDTERILKAAFVSAGYPEPEQVNLSSVSAVEGAGHAMSIPRFSEGGDGLCRYQTHCVVQFRQKIRGPMLVGRGRFRGYGLFRPMVGSSA